MEPGIYQELRQIIEDATHFKEALKLLADVHNIFVSELVDGWGLATADNRVHTEFPLFSEAFRAALELLEEKRET